VAVKIFHGTRGRGEQQHPKQDIGDIDRAENGTGYSLFPGIYPGFLLGRIPPPND